MSRESDRPAMLRERSNTPSPNPRYKGAIPPMWRGHYSGRSRSVTLRRRPPKPSCRVGWFVWHVSRP